MMGARKILIVEDDDDIRDTLLEVCEAEGFDVLVAKHGREALDLLKEKIPGPCIVLLDLMMPVMDGKSFLDSVSAELPGRKQDLSIIVFSAGGVISHPLVKGFLRKPVDLDAVLSILSGNPGIFSPEPPTAPPGSAGMS
jgi:CheY-like chemotaxis protein